MNIKQALKWYDELSGSGIKPGLERVEELLSLLGNPQDKLKYVHVAGTNGKGSFCAMMSCILSSAGYKTGLFTSPYVLSFEEQIQISGEYITENELADVFSFVKEKCKLMDEQPTAFEVLTAAALLYFYNRKCDIVVLECGMGGRNDCTNVVPAPETAVLMSVSTDHTAFLGDTTKKIAEEKCGIIKKGSYAVCYPSNGEFAQDTDALNVFEEACKEENISYSIADTTEIKVINEDITSTDVETSFGKIHIPFGGRHQISNFATVLSAVQMLKKRGYSISDCNVVAGVKKAYMPSRIEKLSDKPLIIMDGGHNPGCANAVNAFYSEMLKNKKTVLLCAIMKDKDFEGTFGSLLSQCSEVVFTRAELERSENPEILSKKAEKYGIKASAFNNSRQAFEYARSKTADEDLLLICGSFYLAREIKKYFCPSDFGKIFI